MLKLLILGAVAVWFLGLFLGRRRRVIRDTTQLLAFILWVVLLFVGGTMLPRAPVIEDSAVLLGLSVAAWFAGSFYVARWTARKLSEK